MEERGAGRNSSSLRQKCALLPDTPTSFVRCRCPVPPHSPHEIIAGNSLACVREPHELLAPRNVSADALLAASCFFAFASSPAAAHRLLNQDSFKPDLTWSEPGESIRTFMLNRTNGLNPDLYALLEACSFGAQSAVPQDKRESVFKGIGHIGQVKDEARSLIPLVLALAAFVI